jgi:DNA-binding NtrC family response regulator
VRELKQRVARLMLRYVGGGLLSVGNIPPEERPTQDDPPHDWQDDSLDRVIRRAVALGTGLKEISRTVEDLAVRIAVADAEGNLQQAAQALGVTDRALQMRRANQRQAEGAAGLRAN